MRTLVRSIPALLGILGRAVLSTDVHDKKDKRLTALFYFQWEQASDPQIAPDGSRIVYVRRWPDIMTDRRFSNMKRVPDEPHGIPIIPHTISPRYSSSRTGSKSTRETRRPRVIDAKCG